MEIKAIEINYFQITFPAIWIVNLWKQLSLILFFSLFFCTLGWKSLQEKENCFPDDWDGNVTKPFNSVTWLTWEDEEKEIYPH